MLEPGRAGRADRQFAKNFGPLEKLLETPPAPADAFIVRVMLLHSWRRIVLHDPQLPGPMLPDDWPGHAAREICGRIYWQVFDASEAHLDALAGRDNERYAPLAADIASRFGGKPA